MSKRAASITSAATTSAGVIASVAIPSDVASVTAVITACASTATSRVIDPVAFPSDVASITTVVTATTTAAATITPISTSKSTTKSTTASAVGILFGLQRSAVRAGDIDGSGFVVITGCDGEFDEIAFNKSAESIGSDGRLMNEEIFGTVIGFDESEAFAVVEPLNNTGESLFCH
jgi:hypothetical protein